MLTLWFPLMCWRVNVFNKSTLLLCPSGLYCSSVSSYMLEPDEKKVYLISVEKYVSILHNSKQWFYFIQHTQYKHKMDYPDYSKHTLNQLLFYAQEYFLFMLLHLCDVCRSTQHVIRHNYAFSFWAVVCRGLGFNSDRCWLPWGGPLCGNLKPRARVGLCPGLVESQQEIKFEEWAQKMLTLCFGWP